jgi:hypothetical protein
LVSHVLTPLPEHCVLPGVQTPVHAPDTHAWFVQDAALTHVPAELHVCSPPPEHREALGAHIPVHAPDAHA